MAESKLFHSVDYLDEGKHSPLRNSVKNFSSNRVCNNVFCPSAGSQVKLSKVKVSSGLKWMCPTCELAYRNKQFCYFCDTIYFLDVGSDNRSWICCDSCDRWVHQDCDERLLNCKQSTIQNIVYICPMCEKKAKNKKVKDGNPKKKVKPGLYDYSDESSCEFIPAFNILTYVEISKQFDFASVYIKIPEIFDQVLSKKKANKSICEKYPLISNLLTSSGLSYSLSSPEIDCDLQFCIENKQIELPKPKVSTKEQKGSKINKNEKKAAAVFEKRNLRSRKSEN